MHFGANIKNLEKRFVSIAQLLLLAQLSLLKYRMRCNLSAKFVCANCNCSEDQTKFSN
jgi:hypothetical protein